MTFPKKEIFSVITGFILTILCIFLSRIDCVTYRAFNGWTMQPTTKHIGFMPGVYLYLGITEIFLLLCNSKKLRILAAIVSFTKVILPWIAFHLLNYAGTLMSDYSSQYTINNSIPYFVTVFATILFLLISISVFSSFRKQKKQPPIG